MCIRTKKGVLYMRIAIPCINDDGLDSKISMHFGRSPYYAFIDIDNDEIKNIEVKPVPSMEHDPGDLPNFVKENKGEIVIADGMGGRAVDFFNQLGIKVVTGAQGKVGEIIKEFLEDKLMIDREWREREEFSHHDS